LKGDPAQAGKPGGRAGRQPVPPAFDLNFLAACQLLSQKQSSFLRFTPENRQYRFVHLQY
jgi:hypothetical protein